MMKNHKTALVLALVGSLTSGCAKLGPEGSLFGGNRVTPASANQMFSKEFEHFTDEQLIHLLDPKARGQYDTDEQPIQLLDPELRGQYDDPDRFNRLIQAFRNANGYGKAHRSRIQDRLIAASNQRCNLYKTYLRRLNSYTNGIFGTLTTILGGAGAITTGESATRLLSGLSGISSGTRGELTKAIFDSIATSIIIPGIEKARYEIKKEMLDSREEPLSKYTVEGAIADVIRYHGACSINAGISYTQKKILSPSDFLKKTE